MDSLDSIYHEDEEFMVNQNLCNLYLIMKLNG